MSEPDICHFCAHEQAVVTVNRDHAGIPPTMRLCHRCAYTLQMILQTTTLTAALSGPPCLFCGKLAEATGNTKDKSGQFLGRFAICRKCFSRSTYEIDDILRQCTLWSPGILELPSPVGRIFPEPRLAARPQDEAPGSGPVSNN